MTQAVSTTQTGFDSTSDPVASATQQTYASSVETVINNILNGAQAFDRQLFQAAASYQIYQGQLALVNGSTISAPVAPLQALITVSAESGIADTLDTIGVSNQGFVVLKAASSQTITLSSGVGNITTIDGTSFTLSGNGMVMLWCANSQWSVISPGSGVQNTLNQALDPDPTISVGSGYSVGSLWANTTKDNVWINVDATLGTAIWKRITPPKNQWSVRAAAATVSQVGIAAPSVANTPVNSNDSTDTMITLPTTNSSGNIGGWVTGTFNLVRPAHDPTFECYIKMDATITTERIWIGFTSADVTNVDTLAASTKFIGFRWSTTIGEAGWTPILNDGTTQNAGTTIGTVSASTVYKLKVRIISATPAAYFSVNDGAEQLVSTNFPAIATDMGACVRCITTSAAIRLINFATFKVWWG